jgi:hypothetical protein
MKEWYTPQELAGLPELPNSARRVLTRAEAKGWTSRKKEFGKGFEFSISSLPAAAQKELRHREAMATVKASVATEAAAIENQRLQELREDANAWAKQQLAAEQEKSRARERHKQDGLARFAALNDGRKKAGATARQFFVLTYLQYYRAHHASCSKTLARTIIAERINSGELLVPAEHVEFIPQYRDVRALTEKTLQRWELQWLEDGIWGLVDNHGHRKHQSIIETNRHLYEVVLGAMVKHPHITARKIKLYLQAEYPQLDIVSERAISRFKTDWIAANHQVWTFITNPDRWKNVYMAAVGSQHENIVALNQLWEMDSTPADWMLTDGRHSVVGVIDLYSRRLRFYVAKTSSGYAVCQAFRSAVIVWGLPQAVRTDNGKDYVSEHFETVLNGLDIGHELCLPFASEEKGTIERAMRTMSHGILDLLPGFIGHNVAERKQIEARKSFAERIMKTGDVIEVALSAAELQEKLDTWSEHLYGKDPHGGLDGKSPWQVANAWAQPIRRIENVRALDALLAPVDGMRTITKKGLRLDHFEYFAEELFAHVGEQAQLKLDEHDIGRVFVYLHGAFLCVAECPELLGISRGDKASATKHAHKKLQREQAAELKEFGDHIKRSIPDAVLQMRIDQSENVTELPKRSVDYTTPALEEAGRAAQARLGNQAVDRDDEADQAARETARKVLQLQTTLTAHQEILRRDDLREMYAHWQSISSRIASEQHVTDEERGWFHSYQGTSQFRAAKMMEVMRNQQKQQNQ